MTEKSSLTTEELLARVKTGDKTAESTIIEQNMGLVWSVVKRFYNRGHEPDDLFQVGCIGMLKAVQKFDFSFDVKFSTYAVPVIMGEIKRFIRDDGIIKVSRSLKETAYRASVVKETLQKQLLREPTIAEIAEKLGISAEELATAMDAAIAPESIYAESETRKSQVEKLEAPEDYEGEVIDKLIIRDALSSFAPRERQIIILRYFKQKTQSQIAQMLGISQVQVSRIEKAALLQMRKIISGSK
ncbi:MAG: SigB/SigF/SigG family RNA polymerase sigma factor [Oscillospiraceae bacterium]|nr:SigB/SigF/SigG family RNA polymerase sigma factor [Oscillospiraceae bacterium]